MDFLIELLEEETFTFRKLIKALDITTTKFSFKYRC